MTKQLHLSSHHEFIHKAVSATALCVALVIGVPAVQVVTTRFTSDVELREWCAKSGCIGQPGAFNSDPLVVYADKAKEAAQLVSRLYPPSPLSFLDIAAPEIKSRSRAPDTSRPITRGQKK